MRRESGSFWEESETEGPPPLVTKAPFFAGEIGRFCLFGAREMEVFVPGGEAGTACVFMFAAGVELDLQMPSFRLLAGDAGERA